MAGKSEPHVSSRSQRHASMRRPTQSGTRQNRGFNFTARMTQLCTDVVTRTPELRHIDMSRVAVSFNQTRKQVRHGLWASLTPMRFEDGAETTIRRGRKYTVQRIYNDRQIEMLYILSFYLPRFMQLSFQEKLTTVFHELWHISPHFDGDIRRHPGRCYAHTRSEKEYDAQMERLSQKWLRLEPPVSSYEFLRKDFSHLQREFGQVFGQRVKHPKLILIDRQG